MIKIVAAIDGNVNTGKTGLFQRLKEQYPRCVFSEEYREVKQKDDLERQLMYLEQDEKRISAPDSDIILDRSVLSLFGYVYWLYESNQNDIRCEFYSHVVNGLSGNRYVLPNRILYCYQDYDSIIKSFEVNHHIKGTDDLLVSKEYYETQNDFYERLIKMLDGRVIKYNYLSDECNIDIYEEEKYIDNYQLLTAVRYALKINDMDCITSINGTSSVGKSSLCSIFEENNRRVIGEVNLVNKSDNEESALEHQTAFYTESLKRYLNKGNIVIDNGIFETISYTFFLAASKGYGMNFIHDYFNQIMNIYEDIHINQTFYLYVQDEELIRRKNSDLSKIREHFNSNISFRTSEIKFARLLSKELKDNLFILIDANKTKDEIYKECVISGNFCKIQIKRFLDVIYKKRYEIYQFYTGGKI